MTDSICNHMAKGELDDDGFAICSNCKQRFSTKPNRFTHACQISNVVNLKEVDGNVVIDDLSKPFSWGRQSFDPAKDEAEHLERIKRELEK